MLHGPAPMILADTPLWLSISINLLLVLQVVVSILLVGIVLMQRPKQEGLGAAFGAGMTDQMFGARTTSVLQRGTVYLGVAFFVLALALAVLIGQRSKHTNKSLLAEEKRLEAPAAPAAPATPASLSEQVKKAEEAAKAADSAQVPAPAGDQPAGAPTPQPETPAQPAQPTQPQPEAPAAPQAPAGGGQ